VLDQLSAAGAAHSGINGKPAYDIELVITRKEQRAFVQRIFAAAVEEDEVLVLPGCC
jgi:hypothetical protein